MGGQLQISDDFEGIAEYHRTLEIVQAGEICDMDRHMVLIGLGPRIGDNAMFSGMAWWGEKAFDLQNVRLDAFNKVKRLEPGDIIGMTLKRNQDALHFHINGKHVKSIQ